MNTACTWLRAANTADKVCFAKNSYKCNNNNKIKKLKNSSRCEKM